MIPPGFPEEENERENPEKSSSSKKFFWIFFCSFKDSYIQKKSSENYSDNSIYNPETIEE